MEYALIILLFSVPKTRKVIKELFSKSVSDAVISNENTVTTCKVEIETMRQKQENENQCSGRPDVTNLKYVANLHKR